MEFGCKSVVLIRKPEGFPEVLLKQLESCLLPVSCDEVASHSLLGPADSDPQVGLEVLKLFRFLAEDHWSVAFSNGIVPETGLPQYSVKAEASLF